MIFANNFYILGVNSFKDFWSYSDIFSIFMIYLSFSIGNLNFLLIYTNNKVFINIIDLYFNVRHNKIENPNINIKM